MEDAAEQGLGGPAVRGVRRPFLVPQAAVLGVDWVRFLGFRNQESGIRGGPVRKDRPFSSTPHLTPLPRLRLSPYNPRLFHGGDMRAWWIPLVVSAWLLVPALAFAQASITGVVKDSSGAV